MTHSFVFSAGGYQSNMKMKRARASGVRSKSTLLLYNKLTDVVENLAELINIQQLTDTIILQVGNIEGLSAYGTLYVALFIEH